MRHPKRPGTGKPMNLLEFVRRCTFDDFLFIPQCDVLPSRDPDAVDLSTRFSEHG